MLDETILLVVVRCGWTFLELRSSGPPGSTCSVSVDLQAEVAPGRRDLLGNAAPFELNSVENPPATPMLRLVTLLGGSEAHSITMDAACRTVARESSAGQ